MLVAAEAKRDLKEAALADPEARVREQPSYIYYIEGTDFSIIHTRFGRSQFAGLVEFTFLLYLEMVASSKRCPLRGRVQMFASHRQLSLKLSFTSAHRFFCFLGCFI